MIVYQYPDISPAIACPYLPDQTLTYEYFYAANLNARELSWFLSRGWRKFGVYYFRPSCPDCQACTPIRILVQEFEPTRSQSRVLRLGRDVRSSFGSIRYEERLFEIYCEHSKTRFGQDCIFEEFISNLHTPSCPTLLSRYELEHTLIAAGYLDQSVDALSSVYFVYDTRYSKKSLGILSILREIEQTKNLGLKYYYLGYFVPGCDRMAYKTAYFPQERYSWQDKVWINPYNSAFSDPYPGKIHPFEGWTGLE